MFTSQSTAAFYDKLFSSLDFTLPRAATGRRGFSKKAMVCTPRLAPHGLRMNRKHYACQESVILGTAAALSCKTDFLRILLQNIQGYMPNHRHVFGGMVLSGSVTVFVERHIQTPMHRAFNSPMRPDCSSKEVYIIQRCDVITCFLQ